MAVPLEVRESHGSPVLLRLAALLVLTVLTALLYLSPIPVDSVCREEDLVVLEDSVDSNCGVKAEINWHCARRNLEELLAARLNEALIRENGYVSDENVTGIPWTA